MADPRSLIGWNRVAAELQPLPVRIAERSAKTRPRYPIFLGATRKPCLDPTGRSVNQINPNRPTDARPPARRNSLHRGGHLEKETHPSIHPSHRTHGHWRKPNLTWGLWELTGTPAHPHRPIILPLHFVTPAHRSAQAVPGQSIPSIQPTLDWLRELIWLVTSPRAQRGQNVNNTLPHTLPFRQTAALAPSGLFGRVWPACATLSFSGTGVIIEIRAGIIVCFAPVQVPGNPIRVPRLRAQAVSNHGPAASLSS